MFVAPRYLTWAIKHYGKVPYDLASSGLAAVDPGELGQPDRHDGPDSFGRLRASISAFNGVPDGEAIAALGTTHALWLAYASVLQPGDDVLVESPGYEPVWSLAEGSGAKVARFARRPEDAWAVRVGAVTKAMTPRTRVVAITTPHNPSGARIDPETLRRLADEVTRRKAYLLVDEVYAPLGDISAGATVWGKSSRRLGGNVIAVSSLTKSFGLGDARMGWVLGPSEVIGRAEAVLLATCGYLPTRHAAYGAWALSRISMLAARANDLTRGKRETVASWMSRRSDLIWSSPPGGLFGFAIRTRPGDVLADVEAGIAKEGVLVAPGTFFGIPEGFRVSWTIPREKLDGALDRLSRALPA